MTQTIPDYFRRDQDDGITAPNLLNQCTFSEHIVHARGKRTQFTSLSLDPKTIKNFGPVLYQALSAEIRGDGHVIVEHEELMSSLADAAKSSDKAEKLRAVQARRYAKTRKEGLVHWSFTLAGVERKDVISWAFNNVQKFFKKA